LDLFLAVRRPEEPQPRLFPLVVGRTWRAGRYMGPLQDGRYIRDQEGPPELIPEYIPLEKDPTISRSHFEAGCDHAGPWVRDLSVNGTTLNGVRLRRDDRHPLRPDDQLQVGRCAIVVAYTARIDPAWRTWNGGTVVQLAGAIHEDRGFELLPVLADALEEAGCGHLELLGHLRKPAAHPGGFLVVDAILGHAYLPYLRSLLYRMIHRLYPMSLDVTSTAFARRLREVYTPVEYAMLVEGLGWASSNPAYDFSSLLPDRRPGLERFRSLCSGLAEPARMDSSREGRYTNSETALTNEAIHETFLRILTVLGAAGAGGA
jgi:hypothetical protein